jgi:Matrixin
MILSHRMLGIFLLLLTVTPFQSVLSEVLGTKWPKPSATFLTGNLPPGGPAGSLPGNTETWRAAASEAANRWNDAQSAFKLVTSNAAGNGICQSFGDNNLSFSTTACNNLFGANTLAVTAGWSSGGTIIKADIIFNSNKAWGIYDGPIRFSPEDFRRVATHELGHAIGLAHTTTSSALMFATASNTFLPTPDDVTSLESIYAGVEESDSGGAYTYLLLLILGIRGLRLVSAHKKAD